MAKFLPIVQLQMDLRKKLAEAKLADYFERLCQDNDGTFNALWDAMLQHPTAQLVIRGNQETDGIISNEGAPLDRVFTVGERSPTTGVAFVTLAAILELVKEAKSIYANAEELLRWLKEKKLDQ